MPQILLKLFIPFAVSAIKSYISNSSSEQDDKVLDVVQLGCKYLCAKDNNNVDYKDIGGILASSMVKGE